MITNPMSPARIITLLVSITFILLTIHLACVYVEFFLQAPYPFAWVFYFDKRMTIPFFFSMGLLVAGAALSYRIFLSPLESPSRSRFWNTLSLLLASIAFDKFFHLHNKVRTATATVTGIYDPASPLYHIWTLPYVLFLIYIVFRFRNSFGALPSLTKKRMSLAFALVVTGGLFLELAGVYYSWLHHWTSDFYHVLIKTTEELFQILGFVVIIFALADHRRQLKAGVV